MAELTILAGLVLTVAAAALLLIARRTRRDVRRADWLLTRASLACAEAQRASIMVGGSQLVDHLLGIVARDGEPDADAAG
ncbi:MAG: hypothetical protein ACRDSK_30915 [Actinophytocola sp.]|uniref:hypothetical protein n=1 Tax=Actinophytocola sp. TaxID=1872138 RepID=UPI003D6B2C9F